MATTALEEEKRKAIGYSFPQNVPEGGSIYRKRPLASDAQGQSSPGPGIGGLGVVTQAGPSLNAPWYSREYATAANMSDKSGIDLERMRAAGATGIPQDDPMRRLAAVGTLSTGTAPATPAQPSPAAKPVPSGTSLVTASQSQRGEGSIPGTTAPTTPAAPTTTNQGMGIVRVDTPGASPLFTNMPTGDQSNVNMMARGVPSVQNEKAMDALAARYATAPAAAQPQQPAYGGMASMGAGTNTGGFGILDANYQRERALRMDAADTRNPGESRRAYEARIAGATGALNTFRGEQTAAPRLAAAQKSADAKTQADMALASRKMAFDEAQGGARMGLDAFRMQDEASTNALRRKTAQADLDTKAQLDAARQEYLAAGDDPAKQKLAARKLAAFGIKDGQKEGGTWDSIVVGGGVNEQGMKVGGTAMLYNNSTGEIRPIGEQQAQAGSKPTPTAKNIAALKADPSLAAYFEQQFGADALKQHLKAAQ